MRNNTLTVFNPEDCGCSKLNYLFKRFKAINFENFFSKSQNLYVKNWFEFNYHTFSNASAICKSAFESIQVDCDNFIINLDNIDTIQINELNISAKLQECNKLGETVIFLKEHLNEKTVEGIFNDYEQNLTRFSQCIKAINFTFIVSTILLGTLSNDIIVPIALSSCLCFSLLTGLAGDIYLTGNLNKNLNTIITNGKNIHDKVIKPINPQNNLIADIQI